MIPAQDLLQQAPECREALIENEKEESTLMIWKNNC